MTDLVSGDDNLYVKLIVPTDESISGFFAGSIGDGIEATGGEVLKEAYTDYVGKLTLADNYLELGVYLSDGALARSAAIEGKEPERHIQIPYDDITHLRLKGVEGFPGLYVETEDELFKLKVGEEPDGLLDILGRNLPSDGTVKAMHDAIAERVADHQDRDG